MKTTIKIVVIAIMGFNFIATAQEYMPKTGGNFTGNVSFSDNASLLTNRIDDTGSSPENAVRLVAHWWPQDTDTRNLGSELLRWRNLWISKNGFFGSGIGVGTDVIEHTMQLGNAVDNVSFSLRGPDGNESSSYISFEDNQGLTKQWFRLVNNTQNNLFKISSYEVENLMTFTRTNGYVGIGTLSPKEKFQIEEGNIAIQGFNTSRYIRFTESNLQGAFINYDGSKNVLNIGVNDTNTNDIANDSNAISILRSNGNVGIGTTAPNEKLQIEEGNIAIQGFNTSRYIRFTESNLLGAFINYDGSTNILNIGVNDTNTNDIANDSNAISILRSNGRVGIGTATPSAKLTVKGKIHAEEVKVYSPVAPDYVFQKYYDGESTLKPDYTMPTLQEVEAYTKQNHHLPEIPSAKELEKEGLKLGDMINKLLQKIEELTLYTIQQEKTIKKLEEENNVLKNDSREIQLIKQEIEKLKEKINR